MVEGAGLGVVLGAVALALSVLAGAGTVVAMTRSVPAQFRRVASEATSTALHLESAFESQRATVSAVLESIENERAAVQRERKRLRALQPPDGENGKRDGPDPAADPHAYASYMHAQRAGEIRL